MREDIRHEETRLRTVGLNSRALIEDIRTYDASFDKTGSTQFVSHSACSVEVKLVERVDAAAKYPTVIKLSSSFMTTRKYLILQDSILSLRFFSIIN
jgi:hypothetical protein